MSDTASIKAALAYEHLKKAIAGHPEDES